MTSAILAKFRDAKDMSLMTLDFTVGSILVYNTFTCRFGHLLRVRHIKSYICNFFLQGIVVDKLFEVVLEEIKEQRPYFVCLYDRSLPVHKQRWEDLDNLHKVTLCFIFIAFDDKTFKIDRKYDLIFY